MGIDVVDVVVVVVVRGRFTVVIVEIGQVVCRYLVAVLLRILGSFQRLVVVVGELKACFGVLDRHEIAVDGAGKHLVEKRVNMPEGAYLCRLLPSLCDERRSDL